MPEVTSDRAQTPAQAETIDVATRRPAAGEGVSVTERPCPGDEGDQLSWRSSDDLAAAVAQAVDRVQLRLSEVRNPTSRFAVRELRVEANVELDVDSLGRLRMRFPAAGRPVQADRLDRLTLTVVPVARDTPQGSWVSDRFDPSREVESLPAVDEAEARRLMDLDLGTVGELAAVGSRARARVELAAATGARPAQVRRWAEQAELLTIRQIKPRHVTVLQGLGVSTLADLAPWDPAALREGFLGALQGEERERFAITVAEAACWIGAARQYLGLQGPFTGAGGDVAYY